MRQRNGAELFGDNDPRNTRVGIIEVGPGDDRQALLTAILTQDKLDRKQTVIVIPEQTTIFRRASDFKDFENTLPDLHTQLVFVAPDGSPTFKFARQRQYLLFISLEKYTQYAQTFLREEQPESPLPVPTAETASIETPLPVPVEKELTQPLANATIPAPVTENTTIPPAAIENQKEAEQPLPVQKKEPKAAPVPVPSTPQEPLPILLAMPLTPAQPAPVASPAKLKGKGIQAIKGNDDLPDLPASTPAPVSTKQPLVGSTVQQQPAVNRGRRRIFWLLLCLLLLLLLLGGVLAGTIFGLIPLASIFPGIASATLTITPDSKNIQQNYTLSAVPTLADASQQQVQARVLAYTTAPQTQKTAASGVGHIPATTAQGNLIFYNALTIAQTVRAGTVFTDDNGVQVVSDEDAVIVPISQFSHESHTEVTAHAVTSGAAGNIHALDFSATPCCHPGITVWNLGDFTGGFDEQSYQYVQQSDIETTTITLKNALLQNALPKLQAMVTSNERAIDNPQCIPDVSYDHSAGVQAQDVTITEKVTCRLEVYDQSTALLNAENSFKTAQISTLGTAYTLTDPVVTTIMGAKVIDKKGTIALSVRAAGRWVYQFSTAQKNHLLQLIAGKGKQEAEALLAQQSGVSKANLDLSLLAGNIVPSDPHQINVLLQNIH